MRRIEQVREEWSSVLSSHSDPGLKDIFLSYTEKAAQVEHWLLYNHGLVQNHEGRGNINLGKFNILGLNRGGNPMQLLARLEELTRALAAEYHNVA